MKTIEKIRQKIEELYDGEAPAHDQQCEFEDGYFTGIAAISKFLDTLEEPDKCKGCNNVKGCIACVDGDQWAHYEEPVCEELNEAAEKYADAQPEIENVTYHDSFDIIPQLEQAFIAGANWQAERFEKNRLAACDNQTKEEYDREVEFATSIIEKEHRQPTFSDAINYGMKLQKEQDNNFQKFKEYTDRALISIKEAREQGQQEMKEQMMKEAVEGRVISNDGISFPVSNEIHRLGLMEGDKVKLIIIKEDEK